ncbi:hypothetical protein KA078_00250 [Candidatus Woesebacteria bacterium]|nr:hypothetical protein [Candidatus Woesebacteria bacterium]
MSEYFNINEITGLGKLSRLVQKLDAMFTGPTAGKLSNTKISRRTFLKSALIASGLLLAACGEDEKKPPVTATPTKTPEPTATLPPTPTSTPTAIPEAEAVKTIERKIEYENMRLFVDATNIPVAYEIIDPKTLVNSTGVIFFDWQQREAFKAAKEQMESTGFAQVPEVMIDDPTTLNSIWNMLSPDEESEEHPWITRLPEDVANPERLAANGVRIHSDQSTSAPQLHIREQAFQPGGLLEPLRLLNEYATTEADREFFDIYIINAPRLSASALTREQREQMPADILNYLAQIEGIQTSAINGFRDEYIAGSNELIVSAEDRVRTKKGIDGDLTPEEVANTESGILRLKQDAALVGSLSPFELWFRFGMQILENNPTSDWTLGFQQDYLEDHRSLIAVPAGDGGVQAKDRFVFSYGKDGTIGINRMNTIDRRGKASGGELLPLSSRSYPRIEDFIEDSSATYQNGKYSYGAQTIGQTLRHEIIHSTLLEWLPRLKARGLINELEWFTQLTADTNVNGHITFPDANEFITDELTALTIKQAEEYLERKDDDSWYSFVFSIPPNINNPDGAYMITENQGENGLTDPTV